MQLSASQEIGVDAGVWDALQRPSDRRAYHRQRRWKASMMPRIACVFLLVDGICTPTQSAQVYEFTA